MQTVDSNPMLRADVKSPSRWICAIRCWLIGLLLQVLFGVLILAGIYLSPFPNVPNWVGFLFVFALYIVVWCVIVLLAWKTHYLNDFIHNSVGIGAWAMLTFVGVPFVAGFFGHGLILRASEIESVRAEATGLENRHRVYFKFENAKQLALISKQRSVTRTKRDARRSSTTYYNVNYFVSPLVAEGSPSGAPVRYFLASSTEVRSLRALKPNSVFTLVTDSQDVTVYRSLAVELEKENRVRLAPTIYFLHFVDLEELTASRFFYAGLSFALLFGLWCGVSLFAYGSSRE